MKEVPIVFIGHKDHGKSSLIARLLLDTNSVKQSVLKDIKSADKEEGKNFEIAHILDSFKEERQNEMTIDSTTASIRRGSGVYQLIDVPGHIELISNMLTGASLAKAAILVISADEGIKEQTIKHLELAEILGIKNLAVAINKIDLIGYEKEGFLKIVSKIKPILQSVGFNQIQFFPVSAKDGSNVIKKSKSTPWYKGKTLADFIFNVKVKNLKNEKMRFLVQDRFAGPENIIVGRVESGTIKKGQEICFFPGNIKAKIKFIKDFEKEIKKASAGQGIGIVLDKDIIIERGSVGFEKGVRPTTGKILKGKIFWIDSAKSRKLICECGNAAAQGTILSPKKPIASAKSLYKISLDKCIVYDPESSGSLGKIVLKEDGKIIAVGNTL